MNVVSRCCCDGELLERDRAVGFLEAEPGDELAHLGSAIGEEGRNELVKGEESIMRR